MLNKYFENFASLLVQFLFSICHVYSLYAIQVNLKLKNNNLDAYPQVHKTTEP